MKNSVQQTRSISAQVVNAFVVQGEYPSGNPAGVVIDADHLSEKEMLTIAGNIGLSETAFVSRSDIADFKLDFFTPNRRIAHCGHATVATFSYLKELGRVNEGITSKETVDGPRKIMIKDGAAYMEQLAPQYKTAEMYKNKGVLINDICASLGLNDDDLNGFSPVVVNTGNNFLIINVTDENTLKAIKPNFDLIHAISDKLDLIGYYVFALDNSDANTRMFAPRYAINEEAATGMAAGPLACVLRDFFKINKDTFLIKQGDFMQSPSPSLITVMLTIDNGKISGLMAGGFGHVSQKLVVGF